MFNTWKYPAFLFLVSLTWAAPIGAGEESANALLGQWKQALRVRMQFESKHPRAAKLFQGVHSADWGTWAEELSDDSLDDPSPLPRGWKWGARALALNATKPHKADSLLALWVQSWNANPGWLQEASLTATRSGAFRLADTLKLALRRSLLSHGYHRTPELAMVSIKAARELAKESKYTEAFAALEHASALDPTCPWIPIQKLEILIRQTGSLGSNLGNAIGLIGQSISLLRFYNNFLPFAYNLFHTLWFGLILFWFVGLVVLIGRYFSRLTHGLAEKLPQTVTLPLRYLAIGLVLFSALVAGMGIGLASLAVIPWLWQHVNRQEKGLLKWMLVGLLLFPAVQMTESALISHLDSRKSIHAYHLAYWGGFDASIMKIAERVETQNGEDSLLQALAQSLQFKKMGNSQKALQSIVRFPLLDTSETFGNAANLLGIHRANLSMMNHDYANAEKILGQVQPQMSSWMELWFNSSQAALFQNNSNRHKNYLDKAAERDPAYITNFLKENDVLFVDVPDNRRVLDPMLRTGMVLNRMGNDWMSAKFLSETITSGLLQVSGGIWLLACAASLLTIYFWGRKSYVTQGKNLFECKICGKIMCRACRKGVHCDGCFKTVSGISEPKMRQLLITKLRTRSQTFLGVLYRAMNIAFPGTGWLFVGQSSRALLWMLMTAVSFAMLWQARHLVKEYPLFSTGLLPFFSWVLLAALYAYSIFTSVRSKPNATPISLSTESEGDTL